MSVFLRLEPSPGAAAADVAMALHRLATELGIGVVCSINGAELILTRTTAPQKALERWHAARQAAAAQAATPIDLAGLLRMMRDGHARLELDREHVEMLIDYIDRLEAGYRKVVELAVDAEPAGRAGRAYDVGRMAGLDAAMMAVPEIVDSAPFRFSSADRAPGGAG